MVGGAQFGGLSPLSSLSSMPSSAASAVAAALLEEEDEAESRAASAAAAVSSPLPPFAEGSRLKLLNRIGINVRPTNDMVVSFLFSFFLFFGLSSR